jgi:hypothetical protein
VEGLLDAIETAATENCGDDGARGLRIAEAHVAAGDVAVDGHFGDEGDADTGRNHSQKAAELSAFKSNAGRDAGARAGINTKIPEAVAVAQHDERLAAEIFEGERFCGGARMVFSQRRKQRLGSDAQQLQILVAQGERKNRDIDREVTQTFYEDGSRFFNDAKFCVRVFPGETGHIARYEVGRDSGDDADGDTAAKVGMLIGGAGARGFRLLQNCAGARNESAAGLGEANAATEAVEEFGAQLFFEFQHLLGKRRLGNLAALGGAAEIAGVGDGANVAKLVEFHRVCLYLKWE